MAVENTRLCHEKTPYRPRKCGPIFTAEHRYLIFNQRSGNFVVVSHNLFASFGLKRIEQYDNQS